MRKKSFAGSIYLSLIGVALIAMGSLFMFLMWNSYLKAQETREWPTVDALILESAVRERKLGPQIPVEFSLSLLYGYEYEGVAYTGDHLKRRENPWYKEKAKIFPEVEQWSVGAQVQAFVNPENPEEAVLAHDTKAGGYSIWFPALFVIGGLGIVISAARKIMARDKSPLICKVSEGS